LLLRLKLVVAAPLKERDHAGECYSRFMVGIHRSSTQR